jgi:hypothetical protein
LILINPDNIAEIVNAVTDDDFIVPLTEQPNLFYYTQNSPKCQVSPTSEL